MKYIGQVLVMFLVAVLSAYAASPVPYSGKIDIRGVNYFGEAQFAFSLHDGNATTHWRNGNQPKETIKVTIRNGRYNVLLGGQGMNSLPPELFLNHDKLYLKVEFDMEDGEGLRHLAPDQLITATPRALVADLARVSEVAKVAEKVGNGAITREMLSQEVLSQLDANATASPTAPVTITTSDLSEQILKYLKPEITSQPQAQEVSVDSNVIYSVSAVGKYLTYQWKKDGSNLTGKNNSTLSITDANATLHDGNYSVIVSNDFGSEESVKAELKIHHLNSGMIAWWTFDTDGSDKSGLGNDSSPQGNFEIVTGKVDNAIRVYSGGHIILPYLSSLEKSNSTFSFWVKEESITSHGEAYLKIGQIIEIGNYYNVTFSFLADTGFESAIQRNNWNHYVITRFQNSQTGFLNGTSVGTGNYNYENNFSFTLSAIAKHWWSNGTKSSTRLTGLFDDYRIYDRALSAAEVQALYNLGQ